MNGCTRICGSCVRVRPSKGLQSCAFGAGVLVGGSGVLVAGTKVGVKEGVYVAGGLLVAGSVCPGVGDSGADVQEARLSTSIKGSIENR